MSEFEVFFRDNGSKYGEGFVLNKYGDRYSLVAARESKDGVVYKEWCFPQDKDRKPKDKTIPMGVRLGNYAEAVAALKAVLAALETPAATHLANKAVAVAKAMGGKVVAQDDIPF